MPLAEGALNESSDRSCNGSLRADAIGNRGTYLKNNRRHEAAHVNERRDLRSRDTRGII